MATTKALGEVLYVEGRRVQKIRLERGQDEAMQQTIAAISGGGTSTAATQAHNAGADIKHSLIRLSNNYMLPSVMFDLMALFSKSALPAPPAFVSGQDCDGVL